MADHHETSRTDASSDSTLPIVATVAMVVWVLFEFGLRRGFGPQLANALDSYFAAEGAIMIFAIPVVAGLIAWWGTKRGIDPADWEYVVTLRSVGAGIASVVGYWVIYLVMVIVIVAIVGMEQAAAASGGIGDGQTWAIALYFVGNAVFVPISEELAWRGVIQTALTESYGTYVAIVVTALAFVAKHLIVDLAVVPIRLGSLLILAFILCGLRALYGTASSTVAHLGMNMIATGLLVL